MLNIFAKEFIAIVKHLKNSGKFRIKNNYLLVKKDIVVSMLDKNLYELSWQKLRTWKRLNWIDADDRRIVKRVVDRGTGERSWFLKIDLSVFDELVRLTEMYEKRSKNIKKHSENM